jgi:hypothetical protein
MEKTFTSKKISFFFRASKKLNNSEENMFSYLLKAEVKKGDKETMKFNEKGVLDLVEFKIWNLNQKHLWKQVKLKNAS